MSSLNVEMHSRGAVKRVLQSGGAFWWLLVATIGQVSSQDEQYCSGGVCVEPYLCTNGTIVTSGEGLIDQRVSLEECPNGLVCCSFENSEHVSGSEGCAGTCVPIYHCLDNVYGTQEDGNKASHCPGDDVCCGRVRQSGSISAVQGSTDCLGRCVPSSQCKGRKQNTAGKDLIDLRLTDEDDTSCGDDLVCCHDESDITKPVIQVPKVCESTCVAAAQCSNSSDPGLIDLRSNDDACPQGLICCNQRSQPAISTSTHETCQCVTAHQCLDSTLNNPATIDLRLNDENCIQGQVCCQNLRPAVEVPIVCEGSCVPLGQCSRSASQGLIDLRSYDDACSQGLICCDQRSQPAISTPTHETCQCVAAHQCLDSTLNNPDTIDLRVNDENCIQGQVCCQNVRPTVEVPKVCEGTCVPLSQCGRSTTQGLIDLRGFDGICPDDLVCCPAESITSVNQHCQCTPSQQCLDSTIGTTGIDLIDLRLDGENCIEGEVCCVHPRPTSDEPKVRECKGTCVPSHRCQSTNTSFDLRTYDDCPENQICCEGPLIPEIPSSSYCDGQCVLLEQCPNTQTNIHVIDLRSADSYCPNNLVCCKHLEPTPEIICHGKCVPANLCDYSTILDLRFQDNSCPQNLVCCDSPQTETSKPVDQACPGVCTPLAECADSPRDMMAQLDLRLQSAENGCPGASTICCMNPRKPLTPEIPPASNCDGQCVPLEQCRNTQTNVIDLRSSDSYCTDNLVCCKHQELTPAINCRGKCVPAYLCDSSNKDILDLRVQDNFCPQNLICCDSPQSETPKPVDQACLGVCIPLAECADSPRDMMAQLDLRLQSAENGCPGASTICCMNPKKVSPDQMKWTGWITDINNMIGDDQRPDLTITEKCSPKLNLNSDEITEQEIPWLVTVWGLHQTDSYLCTGSLIRTDVVLIPADCVQNVDESQLFVRSGDYNLKAKAGFEQLYVIRKVIHPDYNGPDSPTNVALLFLDQHGIKSNTPVACLFDSNEQFDETSCLLLGWDSLDQLDVSSSRSVPRKHPLPQLSTASCPQGHLCTTGLLQSTANNCDRLRGSPIVCRDQTGRYWKQAALVSQQNQLCDASGIPALFVATSPSYLWIREQLSPSFVQKPAAQEPSRWYLPSV